jgi:uncharacterized membrane protein YtjA (UPF0391 family)
MAHCIENARHSLCLDPTPFTAGLLRHSVWERSSIGTSDDHIRSTCKGEFEMLYWALVFLIVAIVAGVLGFSGVAIAFAAKIIFFIFLVLLVVSLVAHVRA